MSKNNLGLIPAECMLNRVPDDSEFPIPFNRFDGPGIFMALDEEQDGTTKQRFRCEVENCRLGSVAIGDQSKVIGYTTVDIDIQVLGGTNHGCIAKIDPSLEQD